MEDKIIKDLEKSSTQIIRVALREYEESNFVDIRLWYDNSGEGSDWKPSRKGIAIQVPMLPGLIEAIKEAIEVAKKEGIPTADEAVKE